MDGLFPHESCIATSRDTPRRLAGGVDRQPNKQRLDRNFQQIEEAFFAVRFYP